MKIPFKCRFPGGASAASPIIPGRRDTPPSGRGPLAGTLRPGEAGNVFLVAMGLVALMSMIVGSYLCLVKGQANSVSRSQNFSAAIPVAEAGVEEALALINTIGPWQNVLAANGWSSISSSNTTTKSNSVYQVSASAGYAYYLVTISNVFGGSPVVLSTGVVPFVENAWGGVDVANTTSVGGATVPLTRTVQVQAKRNGLFEYALAAVQGINFGAGARVDSFNSALTNLSNNGQYSQAMRDDQAIVATDSTVSQSISWAGSVHIRGYVNTGTNGTIQENGDFSVGDNAWVSSHTAGIELSRSNDNFNVSFPDVSTPGATFLETANSGTVFGTNYALVFQGTNYWGSSNVMYQQSINLNWNQMALVTNGPVTLYVPNGDSLQFTGTSGIYIAPGSSLTIYCGAQQPQLTGSSFVGATNAQQFTLYGLPTCTQIQYSGGPLTGVIYAPEAAFQTSAPSTIIGAVIARSLAFGDSVTVHYDENLANSGPGVGYAPANWQEIATPLAYQSLSP